MAEQRRITINGRPVGQTQVGRTGVQLERATPKKAYRLPEARRAAAAAAASLAADFGNADWIHQAVEGLELYLERCIMQLSATTVTGNMPPISSGSDYRAFARSAQEIKETMAAEEAGVSAARNVPRYRERPDEVPIPEAEVADPMRITQKPAEPKGWAL